MADKISPATQNAVKQDSDVQAALSNLQHTAVSAREQLIKADPCNVAQYSDSESYQMQVGKAQLEAMDTIGKSLRKHGVKDAPTAQELMHASIGMKNIPNQEALAFEDALTRRAENTPLPGKPNDDLPAKARKACQYMQ